MTLLFLLAFLGGGNVYEGRVVRVIDGDTIRVAIGIWPDEEVTAIRVRGVDTPELKAMTVANCDSHSYGSLWDGRGASW
jgi:endonuclease YncB( thermonuclease family)